MDRTNV